MQIRASAFEGESVSVTDLLADSLALTGSATLDGLTAQERGLRPAAVQRRELHRRVHHGRGRLGRSLLRCAHSHRHRRRGRAVVHGGRVRQLAEHQRRGQRGPAELRHGNHGQHAHHQQHGQRRELHHGGRRVHGHADGLGRSNRGELRSHRGAHGRHVDDHRCGLHGPAGLREPGLHLHGHERWSVDGQRGLRRRDELGHGLRAAALRLQHAHRDQHLRLLGRSLPDEELGGLEQAAKLVGVVLEDPELRGRLLLHVLGRAVHRLVGPRVVGRSGLLKVVAPLPALARHPRGQVLLQRLDAPVHHGDGVAVLGPLRAVHGIFGQLPVQRGELVAQVRRDHEVPVVPRQLLCGALGGAAHRLGVLVLQRFHGGLPGEDVHHHQAVLRLPPRVLAEVDEVGLQPVVRPLSGRLAQRARPGRLHLPAHVGLQRLEGHGLRHVEVALPRKSVQLPRVPHVEVVGQVPQRLHL